MVEKAHIVRSVDRALSLAAPLLKKWPPEVQGLEHVAAGRPALYVGNHTLFGVLDIPFLVDVMVRERGIYPRGLGDRRHAMVPGWGKLLESMGVVVGSRETCDELMRAGDHVLVYPGGAREVMKRKNEKYRLIWSDRVGFARMAIKHAYPIVPFASVGADDCYDIILDAGDVLGTPLGAMMKALKLPADLMPPLVKGWKGTPLPRPNRFYFWFGPPIETAPYERAWEDDAAAMAVRDQTRAAIEAGIQALLARRDPPVGSGG